MKKEQKMKRRSLEVGVVGAGKVGRAADELRQRFRHGVDDHVGVFSRALSLVLKKKGRKARVNISTSTHESHDT